jgi:hypothetical protein
MFESCMWTICGWLLICFLSKDYDSVLTFSCDIFGIIIHDQQYLILSLFAEIVPLMLMTESHIVGFAYISASNMINCDQFFAGYRTSIANRQRPVLNQVYDRPPDAVQHCY